MEPLKLWENICRRCIHITGSDQPTPPKWEDSANVTGQSDPIDLGDVLEGAGGPDTPSEPFIDEGKYGEDHRKYARESIRESGMEALGFYAPIHRFRENLWGVYFHERAFFGTCAEVADLLGKGEWDNIVSDMVHAIDRHECFHAAVELFTLVLEDFARVGTMQRKAAIDKSQAERAALPKHKCPFELYFRNEYQRTWPNDDCLEEALATGYQMSGRFRTSGFKRAMAGLLETAPPAYRRWNQYPDQGALIQGVQELAGKILRETSRPWLTWAQICGARGPVWFPELSVGWLDSKGPIPRRVYRPDRLRPPRFRALLGNVLLKDFLKALSRHYDVRVVSGGKHKAVVFPNGRKTPFPTRRTVSPYLIGEIARALGVPRKELLSKCLGISV